MQKYLSYITNVLFTVIFCAVVVSAQVTGGAVTGSIVDTAGAVVSNATVRIADKLRGQVLTAQTTDAGSYLFPNVPVGEYTLTIEQSGFGSATRELNVALNQTTTVDVALQPAGATNVVDVLSGGEEVVQTDSSQLGKSFDIRKVQDLPINGNPNNLASLAPNTTTARTGTAGSGAVVGGVRSRGNSFNIDGVDNNDPSVTGPATGVIQDAVEEFTLLQNNFNAEFGAGAGGQFNTITRSGTNKYRGNIFTYIGSEKLNAASTDEEAQGFRNFFKEVRYGGTFGGPLPFLNFGEGGPVFTSGKNKLFFFGAYEKYYQAGSGSAGSFFAPTLEGLNRIAAIPGVSPFVINIFRNNVALAPTANAQATADFGTVLGVSGIPFGEVILPIPNSQAQKSYQFNIDHLPNTKNQFRYRYSRSNYAAEQPGSGGLAFNNLSVYDTDLFSAGWIHTFSSNVINDFRFSYRRAISDTPLKDPSLTNFPNIGIVSLNLDIGPGGNLPQGGADTSYQFYDSVTVVSGQHTSKFGGEFRRIKSASDFLPRSRGDYIYNDFDTLLRDLAPDNTNIRGTGKSVFVADHDRYYAFAQDDWKVRPNLTLNLGLRYEYQGLAQDAATQQLNSVSDVPGVISFGVPKVDKNNFAPRVGFAYAPHWDTAIGRLLFGEQGDSSIRANYARAFFTNFSNLTLLNLPPQLQAEIRDSGSATNFLANGGAENTFVPVSGTAASRARTSSFIVDQTVPYADSFAVSYQRQLDKSTGLEFRYLRTRGHLLPVQVQLNGRQSPEAAFVIPTLLSQPTAAQLSSLPTFAQVSATPGLTGGQGTRPLAQFGFTNGAVTSFEPIGRSEYDGVSVSATRRFTKNVGFTAAYTFSKTIDDSTNELFTSFLNPRRPQNAGNFFSPAGLNLDNELGRSTLDIPHRFVTSFNVDIPFFNNSENAFLKAVLGGFQVNGIFQAQSGQPITILAGRDANRNGDGAGDRAIFNPNGDPTISSAITGVGLVNGVVTTLPIGNPEVRAYVATNPNAGFISTGFFASALANNGAGTAARNSFRTQGFNNTDLVILKNTRFGTDGRFNFQIGAEMFNVFNQRQRTIAGVGAFTSAFNTAGNANFNSYGIGSFGGRSITLRGKFYF